MSSLRGREVIIAGGSGGIGAAVTSLLLDEGARVILSYRSNRERAEQCKDRATVLQADLVLQADRTRLLDAAPELYGVVVLSGAPARSESAMQESHDTNYLGPILMAREAAARMKAAGAPGAIVLTSTMQANALFPGSTAYAAQKAALQHAALILAKECRGPADIRVNVISPGVTAAGMAQASIASGKYDRFIQEGVIPRFARAGDIAKGVRFLLEPDNYITGQVLSIDGGMTL
jgi:3-oxoacyl-[acyl-carrier protein] reductase